jgi:hypothetical protein
MLPTDLEIPRHRGSNERTGGALHSLLSTYGIHTRFKSNLCHSLSLIHCLETKTTQVGSGKYNVVKNKYDGYYTLIYRKLQTQLLPVQCSTTSCSARGSPFVTI